MGLKVPVFVFRTLPALLHPYIKLKPFHCCVRVCGHGHADNGGKHSCKVTMCMDASYTRRLQIGEVLLQHICRNRLFLAHLTGG
jgi:hypothetical protein